jgi:hypothetical protein
MKARSLPLRSSLVLALCLFALCSLPYVYAWATVPADRVYTGLAFDVPDHAQYWSWVTASQHGLFISDTMTPEPNDPLFINPMMWVLGQIKSRCALSFPALFQVWRAGATLLLVVSLLWSMSVLVVDRQRRRAAVCVALFGGGLGWLLVVAKQLRGLQDAPFPMDIYTVEPNTFFAVLAYPYLAIAQALVLLALAGAWRAHRDGGVAGFAVAVGASLALSLSHAYDLITVYGVLGATWLLLLIRSRRVPRRLTLVGLAIALLSGPIAIYYRALTANDPLWREVLAQYVNAGVWTPPHIHLVVLMGVPLLIAVIGVGALFRDESSQMVAVWAVLGPVLAYLPFVFQVKLLTAWQFPLAIAAAHVWYDRVVPRMARGIAPLVGNQRTVEILSLLVLVALVAPTNLYLLAWRISELRRHDVPYFLHRDEKASLDWLASHSTPHDVALAPLQVGQFVPNYGGTRTVLAHWAMTTHYFERRGAVERFFRPETPRQERVALLDRECVTLVIRPAGAPQETYDPASSPDLFVPAFIRGQSGVFRYRRPCG